MGSGDETMLRGLASFSLSRPDSLTKDWSFTPQCFSMAIPQFTQTLFASIALSTKKGRYLFWVESLTTDWFIEKVKLRDSGSSMSLWILQPVTFVIEDSRRKPSQAWILKAIRRFWTNFTQRLILFPGSHNLFTFSLQTVHHTGWRLLQLGPSKLWVNNPIIFGSLKWLPADSTHCWPQGLTVDVVCCFWFLVGPFFVYLVEGCQLTDLQEFTCENKRQMTLADKKTDKNCICWGCTCHVGTCRNHYIQ